MQLVKFTGANLPSLATSLKKLELEVASGDAILKMDKTGTWVFGADQTEVQEGSHWAVNPFSFVHGFIAWGEGEVLGEVMTGIDQPLPALPDVPQGAKKGWEPQIGLSLQCLDGEDKGTAVRYAATSVGGKRGVQTLAAQIAAQVEADQSKPVAIVTLGQEHYQHKQYGKIYTPIFGVTGWMSLDPEAAPAVEAPKAEAEAPKRRRRAPVAA